MGEILTRDSCNPYCANYEPEKEKRKTSILPEFYQCRYHSVIQSVLDRKTSARRPRKVVEVVADDTVTIAVYIGERGSEVRDSDLEYVVRYQPDGCYLFDNRRKVWLRLDFWARQDILERLKEDFWMAVKGNRHIYVEKQKHEKTDLESFQYIFH